MKTLLFLILSAAPAFCAKTTVAQSILNPDGSPASGSALIRITAACKSGPDYAEDKTIRVGFTEGAFTVALVPNDACAPGGTTYTVVWLIAGSDTTRTQTWMVPTSVSPVTVDSVLSPPTPAIPQSNADRLPRVVPPTADIGGGTDEAGPAAGPPVASAPANHQQVNDRQPAAREPPTQADQESPTELVLTSGKSIVVDSQLPLERVSVGFGDIVEGTAISPHQVLLNGKTPGVTSMIVWLEGGTRRFFDITVVASRVLSDRRVENIKREIDRELPGQRVELSFENETVFLRGTVKDLTSADRAVSIASTLGKTVNLLYVDVPPPAEQILLKVKFASVDRSVRTQLGLNLISLGAANTIGSVSTQQFAPPGFGPLADNSPTTVTLTDALNLFFFRPDLNLAATIQALEVKGLLQILAEPNMLAEDGKEASFLAGGEFPFPTVTSGGAGGAPVVSIQFREFGVRLVFIPTVTPRGTIHLEVAPEVSALDFTNGLTVSGFNVPALTTRRLSTQVELNEGQSFAIGGLLDKRTSDTFEKIPFIGDIPILGRLFQSKSVSKQDTELIVIVTPELVRPIPAGQPVPEFKFTRPFLETTTSNSVRTPGLESTGPVPVKPSAAIPVEKLIQSLSPATLPVQPGAPPAAPPAKPPAPPR
jgi:pilus assembly protein CpaC